MDDLGGVFPLFSETSMYKSERKRTSNANLKNQRWSSRSLRHLPSSGVRSIMKNHGMFFPMGMASGRSKKTFLIAMIFSIQILHHLYAKKAKFTSHPFHPNLNLPLWWFRKPKNHQKWLTIQWNFTQLADKDLVHVVEPFDLVYHSRYVRDGILAEGKEWKVSWWLWSYKLIRILYTLHMLHTIYIYIYT